ncbi:PQQ-like beta-propeller repeat protein [Thalassobius sp. Cn5-15]|uniref:outer membrane protein assembly factor BamB family protein n=1 Tax=Thalassobius sp. Cn5-15 TaxID=2917763 RepID=UPI001EF282D0|nr:PQQ-like beta-propeller repeat protein [Thalassobius sp. Cn5-15]
MKSSSIILGLAAAAVLAGCSEREEILPGKREDPRAILSDGFALAEPASALTRAVTEVRLPKAVQNASWTQSAGSPKTRTLHAALAAAPRLAWSAEIGAGDSRGNRITADPVVVDNRIFTLDAQARVTATGTNGTQIWSRDLTPARDNPDEATGGGLAAAGGMLFVSSGFGLLTALDAATGAVQWQQDLGSTGSGAPTVFGDLVYIVGGDDTGWALERKTGRIRWQTTQPGDVNNVLGGPAPAVTDKFAVFAFGDGALHGTYRNGGLRTWTAFLSGQRRNSALAKINDVTADPVISDGRVYVGSHAGRLLALDLESGDRLWTAREGAISPVVAVGGSVYAVSDENQLLRLDARDGATIWAKKLPNLLKPKQRKAAEVYAHHGPILAGGQLIVASNDGKMRFFDPTTGEMTRSVDVPGGATTAPVVAGGTLYVVGTKGQLHAFR